MFSDILPNTISGLLRLAVADLTKVEQDSRYRVNMDYWHTPNVAVHHGGAPVCTVCLAGSVMAKTLRLSPEEWGGAVQSQDDDQ